MSKIDLNEIESNAKTYARTFTLSINKGKACRIWDTNGKEYIDFLSCAGALPLGHSHPYIQEKVLDFIKSGQVLQALDMATPQKIRFVETLYSVLPAEFSKNAKIQFCGPTGSDAVEAAIKLFKTATGRGTIVAFQGGYHGMTAGALSIMGNLNPRNSLSGFSADVHLFPYPNNARCPYGQKLNGGENISLQHIDNMFSDPESGVTKPAMVILEAIQGEGGCIPASPNWLAGLREITSKYDIPLVIDEVQTGIGRTGDWFAFAKSGIIPDGVILSKAVGGGFPLSTVMYHSKYDSWQPGAHAGTFRGNQIAMVAGQAAIQFISCNNVLDNATAMGNYLKQSLNYLREKFDCIGDIRGRGLMLGIEIIDRNGKLDGELAKAIKRDCFKNGLLIEIGGRYGAILRFLPPLIIKSDDIDLVIDILKKSIIEMRNSKFSYIGH